MLWFRWMRPKKAAATRADGLGGRAFRPAASVTTATIDGQTSVLDLSRDRYYGLDDVGTAVWDMVRQERTFEEIVDGLARQYDVATSDLERDVGAFLVDLRSRRLVEDA